MRLLFALKEINDVVKQVLLHGRNAKVWAFHGGMGVGKTTFIHALCEALGVTSVTGSPTYSIINEYKSETGQTFYHMDWYRLKDEEEAIQAGVEDCLFSGNLCFVEWPEKAPALLPDDCLHLTLTLVDEQTREVVI